MQSAAVRAPRKCSDLPRCADAWQLSSRAAPYCGLPRRSVSLATLPIPISDRGAAFSAARQAMSKDHEQETVSARRDFLKGATLTGAAAALAPVVAAADPTPAASEARKLPPPPNPDDTMPPM